MVKNNEKIVICAAQDKVLALDLTEDGISSVMYQSGQRILDIKGWNGGVAILTYSETKSEVELMEIKDNRLKQVKKIA
jgi:hypothetical protein